MSVLTTIRFCFLFQKKSIVVSDPISDSRAVFTLYRMTREPCTETKTAPDRGAQREYSSKPLKHSSVERTLVFKR